MDSGRRQLRTIAIIGSCGLASYLVNRISCPYWTRSTRWILGASLNTWPSVAGSLTIYVDYHDPASLLLALEGVDTVICLVRGLEQLNIIDAAFRAGVKRFAPAEFEGVPFAAPMASLDPYRVAALDRLERYGDTMDSTVFVCGLLYECFAPWPWRRHFIEPWHHFGTQGDTLLDIRNGAALVPHPGPVGTDVLVSMISAWDVTQFVFEALQLPVWPPELRMRGERMSLFRLVMLAEAIKGYPFAVHLYTHDEIADLHKRVTSYSDLIRQALLKGLLVTSEGGYDFDTPNLNLLVPFIPRPLGPWLQAKWATAIVEPPPTTTDPQQEFGDELAALAA